MTNQEEWTPFKWHCSNCGHIVAGSKNQNGVIKVKCNRCQAVMVRRLKSKWHDTIAVYSPEHKSRCNL